MTDLAQEIDFVLRAATRLIGGKEGELKLKSLPIKTQKQSHENWQWIELPEWAVDVAPKGQTALFVPHQPNAMGWQDYDWWGGVISMITSQAERKIETIEGAIHSYSFRLPDELKPAFEYAWVNRIILFLRRWWCHINEVTEKQAFPPIPSPIVHLTHDVDAISKTLAIRSKQAAFCLFNRKPMNSARFLFGAADYWQFDNITELEERFGHRSLWNFYSGKGGFFRSPKEHLFDPYYNIRSEKMVAQIKKLNSEGHTIGLHPRFDTWCDVERMKEERETISNVLGSEVRNIRQHWLRFSFADTWKVQSSAGLNHDYTLGFNDRIGFRNSAALSFIDPSSKMLVTPMILMDSHLFDYKTVAEQGRRELIDSVLDELVETGGEASIIWHQRVFHKDYSWGEAYEYLLSGMKARGIASSERNIEE